MKLKHHTFDYANVIKYALLFFVFVVMNNIEKTVYPYSTAIFVSAIVMNYSLFATPILYLLSFVATSSFSLLGSAIVPAIFFIIVKLIYVKCKAKRGLEFSIFCALSLVGFIIIGDTSTFISYEKRIIRALIITLLSFLSIICAKVISEKGLKQKMNFAEVLSVATIVVVFGIGLSNLFAPYVWKTISVFYILISCYLFKFGMGAFISTIFGMSLAFYYGSIDYIAVFLVIGIASDIFMGLSPYVSAIAVVLFDFLTETVFGVYGGYTLYEFLPVLIGSTFFCIIPTKPLKNLKDQLYTFREKQLVRQSINRNRTMLSNRLYELSSVFTEMSSAFLTFSNTQFDEESVKRSFNKELKNAVCKNCANYQRCRTNDKDVSVGISKMLDIGFAKGKLSLIDVPKEIGAHCLHPTDIIYGLNKMLSEFRTYAIEKENTVNSRALLASEANGVSEILRELALESGSLLKYQSRLERLLSDNLFKKGFNVSELLIYGEDENTVVDLILTMKEFSLNALENVINKTVGQKMTLTEKNNVSEEKIYLSFRRAPNFDAVFGVANAKKDGSKISGDTHSVIRINEQKFLVAISDGMGSGERAETVSSVSLSLIESFYKAGMNSNLILSTVNKLLSINTEDSFTALDISVIDLKNCAADFIKYGAPYGFIINDGTVRIVESNSLPLGILNELSPSVCHAQLNDGDMILLTSDGIADAFGGSNEIIEFVRKLPALNPQTMSDKVLNKAVELSGGVRNDDMTAVAVRIFKKTETV